MTGVLELSKIEQTMNGGNVKDTWLLELPPETCDREGFARGTLVSLTVKNNEATSSVIEPSPEIDDFVYRIVEDQKVFLEEMKRCGD